MEGVCNNTLSCNRLPERREGKVPAAYVLIHEPTGAKYVGSSGDVRARVLRHETNLSCGKHHSQMLQELYDHDNSFEIEIFSTNNKEAAFDKEQELLNAIHGTPQCVNRAKDVKASGRGLPISIESREKMRLARLGGKQTSEHIEKARLSKIGKPPSDAQTKQITAMVEKIKKPISVNGDVYCSLTEAAKHFGTSLSTIHRRVNCIEKKYANWYQLYPTFDTFFLPADVLGSGTRQLEYA